MACSQVGVPFTPSLSTINQPSKDIPCFYVVKQCVTVTVLSSTPDRSHTSCTSYSQRSDVTVSQNVNIQVMQIIVKITNPYAAIFNLLFEPYAQYTVKNPSSL